MFSNKRLVLKNTIECFREIENPNSKDYIIFIQGITSCFRQGTGLGWNEATDIIGEILDETDYSFVKLGE